MNSLSKHFIGATVALMMSSAPVWADELQEAASGEPTAAQLRQIVVNGGQQQKAQQPEVRNVRNSVAVVVRVPKDASGREIKDQAQIKLRLRSMVKAGQKQNIQAVWHKESIPVFATRSVATDAAIDDAQMNTEWWGAGFRPGFGWGGGFRPGWGPGFRPGWGWGGGFRPGFGWAGGIRPWGPTFQPWGWNAGFRPGFWPGVRPWGWNGFVPRPFFGVPTGFYGFNQPFFYPAPAFNYYYYPAAGFFNGCCV